ncbi:MAG: hypothetical protein M1455_10680, partial [Actinobacteria bacterium]|nr:hypothetical protein [Actinomycetota bacterium]
TAVPGSSNYGGVSVMTQLLAEKIEARPVPATVFYPRPRVRSSLLAFRRRPPNGYAAANIAAVKAFVYACFSHRRKKLLNSLADAGPGGLPPEIAAEPPAGRKRRLGALLKAAGLGAGVRAQELTPAQFERLAELAGVGGPWLEALPEPAAGMMDAPPKGKEE